MIRILVVDDEEIIRKRLKSLLELDNFSVCTAENGRNAITVFKQAGPQIALVDIKLPGMDGIELLTHLKEIDEHLEVIIFTGHGGVDTAIQAMKLGAFSYIHKPIEYDELIIEIKRALAKQEMQKKLDSYVESLEQAIEAKNIEIMERKKFEGRVGEQSRFLNNVLESLTHPFYVLNADDYTVTAANSATGIADIPARTTCYMFSQNRKTPCEGQGNICPLRRVKKTRKPATVEHIRRAGDGSEKYVEVHAFPILDDDGKVKQIIEYVIDITERKRAEELERAKAVAEQANKIKSQFLANVSHEIRTPLNAVLGFTELLRKSGVTAEQADYINIIRQSGRDLLYLINGILDISKIEANKFTIEEKVFDLKQLLADLLKTEIPKIRTPQVNLSFTYNDKLPPAFKGDPARIKQIVRNLLDNAVKFTEKGRIWLKVTSGKSKKYNLVITIKDTGIGIPTGKQETIFEPFTQADSSATRKYGGVGLGLHITKVLVEKLGGSIRLKSGQNTGSEFRIRLFLEPAVRPLQPPQFAAAAETDLSDRKTRYKTPENISLSGTRVLVAEDSPVNQRLIRLQLEGYGCAVEVVSNGKAVLEKIKKQDFHICLMDVQMPLINGIRATHLIRGSLKKTIPIIALTAGAMKGDEEKCLAAGMNDFIAKPIDQELLAEKILKLLH